MSLGISFVTFQGFDTVLSVAASSLKGLFLGMPGDAAALLGLADLDFAINLILSGCAAKIALLALRQMIHLITGTPGSGKTLLAVELIVKNRNSEKN